MTSKIHALLADRLPSEEILIFYSGHGIRTHSGTFLCAHDTELARLEINGLRLDTIGRFAASTQASQTLVILDCCYSGGASDFIFSELAPRDSKDRSLHLLASTSANRVAKESKKRQSSSLLKNLEVESFLVLAGRCWGGAVELDVIFQLGVGDADAGWLSGKQFGNADQVIGDQIEQEVGGDASDATMFGLAHGAMLLARSEDALDHRPA